MNKYILHVNINRALFLIDQMYIIRIDLFGTRLFVVFASQTSGSVRQSDSQLLRPFNDGLSRLRGHGVRDFGTESSVQHHEHFQLFDVVDKNFTEAVGQYVSGVLGVSVTDLGHLDLALESSSDSVVNTMRFSPVWLQS